MKPMRRYCCADSSATGVKFTQSALVSMLLGPVVGPRYGPTVMEQRRSVLTSSGLAEFWWEHNLFASQLKGY